MQGRRNTIRRAYGARMLFVLTGCCFLSPGSSLASSRPDARLRGAYAFRFNGMSMVTLGSGNPIPYYLVGIGLVDLDGNGSVTSGKQTSSATPLAGANPKLLVCEYSLSGTYHIGPDGTGTANIQFSPNTTGCAAEKGSFSLALKSNGFWLISTGATFIGFPGSRPPDEVVQVEAVKLR